MKKRNNPTDRFLILQYLKGDTSVLRILVKRYHKVFCDKAYWVTKDAESAKDAAQESWITILKNLHNLKDVDRFKNWAYRIVYNKAIDGLNCKHIESKRLTNNDLSNIKEHGQEDENILRKKTLLSAIRELPLEKQEIIRLFYTEEYSINEISAFLKIPLGTVKSRLFNSREKLKSIIKNVPHEK